MADRAFPRLLQRWARTLSNRDFTSACRRGYMARNRLISTAWACFSSGFFSRAGGAESV